MIMRARVCGSFVRVGLGPVEPKLRLALSISCCLVIISGAIYIWGASHYEPPSPPVDSPNHILADQD